VQFSELQKLVTWTLDQVEVTLVCIFGRGLLTHQIRSKSQNFLWTYRRTKVWTDGPEFSKSSLAMT